MWNIIGARMDFVEFPRTLGHGMNLPDLGSSGPGVAQQSTKNIFPNSMAYMDVSLFTLEQRTKMQQAKANFKAQDVPEKKIQLMENHHASQAYDQTFQFLQGTGSLSSTLFAGSPA